MLRRWARRTAFLLLSAPLALFAQTTPTNPKVQPAPAERSVASPERAPTIKVDVKLVNVFVSVTGAKGEPINDLKKEDFALTEDGVPQKIALFAPQTSLPLSIILAIDTSLSTAGDLKFEEQSAQRFVRAVLDAGNHDALSLYSFSRDVNQVVPFTSDLRRIDRGIEDLEAVSSTSLYDAVYLGAQTLASREGRRVMVVITDGGDNGSSVSYADALRAAQTAQVMLYSIIIVPVPSSAGRDTGGEHALIQLSHDSGARAYYADSMAALDQVFHNIGAELRNQYLLGYYPVRRLSDSDFREVKVSLTPPHSDFTLRYRSGYYTSKIE